MVDDAALIQTARCTNTPENITRYWGRAVAEAIRRPEIARLFGELGAEPVGNTPAESEAFLRAERDRWGAIVEETGVRIQ